MTTMPFKQQCPGCATTVSIKDPKFIGKKIECPKCKAKFLIEDPAKADDEAIEVVEEAPAAAKPAAAVKPTGKTWPGLAKTPEPPKPAPAKPKAAAFAPFKQPCPSCDAPVPIREASQIGNKIECPQCKYRFVAEAPKAPESAGDVEVVEEDGEAASQAVTSKKPAGKPSGKKKVLPKDDDDDDFTPKPKAKPPKSGNLVLILGIGLSVLALALLGVGGYFIFFTGGSDPVNPSKIGKTTKTGPGPDIVEVGPKGVILVEMTNLLPNDAQAVYFFAVKDLIGSIVGSAAFKTPGAFNRAQVEQKLMKLEEIDRVVVADRGKKGYFAVVRTTAKIDPAKLKAALGLQPAEDSPIKKQEYFVTEPSQYLGNLMRLAAELGGIPAAPAKPVSLAVSLVDEQTFVAGDHESVKLFLVDGKPKQLSKPGDAKAPKGASGRYLTIKPALKVLLDRVEAKPPVLVSAAWDLDADPAALANLASQDPNLPPLLRELHSVGAAIVFKDGVTLQLAGEMKNPEFGKNIVDLLKKSGQAISQMGIPIEVDGQFYPPPPMTPGKGPPPPRSLLQRIVIKTLSQDKVAGITIDFILTHLEGTSLLLELIRPHMVYARGLVEMARAQAEAAKQMPIFDLAAALQAYVKKNEKFPRGTSPRSGAGGRTFPPAQRLGWVGDILPYLDQGDIARSLRPEQSWRPEWEIVDKERRQMDDNAKIGAALVSALLDPAYPPSTWWVQMPNLPGWRYGATHFVGVAGVGLDAAEYLADDPNVAAKLGIFGYDRDTKVADIKDGLAGTIALIQVPPTYKRPWIAGGGATVTGVPETKSIQPFVCKEHDKRKGTFAIMADGSVRFIPETISDAAFKALCTINGGEKVDLDKETVLIPAPIRPELKTRPLQ